MAQPATTLDESLVGYTHVIYALHAVSAVIGIATAATIVGSFFFGLPSIVAVILNYARRSTVRGTFLESHFRWQIRTFWFGLLATITVIALSLPLLLVLVGFITLPVCIGVIGLWLVYRVARGWLALRDRRPMYV